MTYGLQIWDSGGNLVLDTSDTVLLLLGSVDITGPGSLTNSNLTLGTPTWFFYPNAYGTSIGTPTVSFSGSTMTWAADSYSGNSFAGTLYYGVK